MGSGLLHIAQGYPGVERGGDECVPQRVRADLLGDPGVADNPADDPHGTVAVQPPSVRGNEEWSLGALADRQVDHPGGTPGRAG